jgi:hypothetical protein
MISSEYPTKKWVMMTIEFEFYLNTSLSQKKRVVQISPTVMDTFLGFEAQYRSPEQGQSQIKKLSKGGQVTQISIKLNDDVQDPIPLTIY